MRKRGKGWEEREEEETGEREKEGERNGKNEEKQEVIFNGTFPTYEESS